MSGGFLLPENFLKTGRRIRAKMRNGGDGIFGEQNKGDGDLGDECGIGSHDVAGNIAA